MNFDVIFSFAVSIFFIVAGVMAKYSHNDGWSGVAKYWKYYIFGGVIYLAINIIKYS